MTSITGGADIAIGVEPDEDEASRIGEYLASHGGPFFELQRRLGVLREDALLAGRRAAIFVALAWGVPFVLSLVAGRAFGPAATHPFLLDFGAWARFFIAVGLFVLAEQQVEYGLQGKLGQLVRAPILAPASFEAAASAVVRALRLRNSTAAEIVCLGLAIAGTLVRLDILMTSDSSTWAVQVADDSAHVTLAGWWSVVCSAPLFYFLLFRGLWRYIVWAMLLVADRLARAQAGCDPSGRQGGPGLSRRISERLFDVRVRDERGDGDHRRQARVRSQHFLGHLRLHHHRLARDRVRVFRLSAAGVLEASVGAQGEIGPGARRPGDALSPCGRARPHRPQPRRRRRRGNRSSSGSGPSAQYAASRKLSIFLMSRSAVAPLAGAALVPFAIAGATRLPYKEVFALVKKLLVL